MGSKREYMRQTIKNLKGEIEFREKLSKQHVSEEIFTTYAQEPKSKFLSIKIKEIIRK